MGSSARWHGDDVGGVSCSVGKWVKDLGNALGGCESGANYQGK